MSNMDNIRIKTEGINILFIKSGELICKWHWKYVEELRTIFRTAINTPVYNELRQYTLSNKYEVHIVDDDEMHPVIQLVHPTGRLLQVFPYNIIKTVWDVLTQSCRIAESAELEVINQTISDQSLMQRSGLPLGLTDNKKMQGEIMKETYHNKELRKFVIASHIIDTPMGIPVLTNNTKPEDRINRIILRGSDYERERLREELSR